jgi:arsenite methyltransferase
MQAEEQLKELVKEKYGQIAEQTKQENESSCCGMGECGTVDYTVFADDYSALKGYNQEADLGLGCGLPTQFAKIKKGDTVLDLGSGAGNDCFVARAEAGEAGSIIGIDFTEKMVNKAKENAEKLGFSNVEFMLGDIEDMPISSNQVDVIVSNCVLNLVPDKQKAFEEIYRVLKNGGHFSISDVVLEGDLPNGLKNDAAMYAGCVSGAIAKSDYLKIIEDKGFKNIQVQKEKKIVLPDEILLKYISEQQLEQFKNSQIGIFSITVYAEKVCCDPKSGCC